jgi:hypothetical protein
MTFRFVIWIVVCSCAAMPVGTGGCQYALAQATAPSPPADLSPRGTAAIAPATSPGKDEDKQLTKLEAEIAKLKVDKITTLVTSIVGVLSAVGFIITFLMQRRMAQESQEQSELANLQLKIAEFVMSSVGPTMARQRLQIFRDLYKDRKGAIQDFIAVLGETDLIKKDDFPGTRRDQLRVELFKSMAAKATSEEETKKAFKDVFPNEKFPNI